MNINGYINKFGEKTFNEVPFNDVDALILSELSYINIDLLFDEGNNSVCLKDIDINKLTKEVFYGSVDYAFNKTMLKRMITSKRYQDIICKDVVQYFSIENVNQFYALTIVLPNNDIFISYRGTDITLIGWKEDFLITYQQTITAQKQAFEYAKDILSKCDNRFYLGGHSKGGNLAFYSALNLDESYDQRFIGAYSFDGPGFADGIKHYESYQRVKRRLFKFLTYFDVIGSVFSDVKRHKVVHSTGLLFGGHDPFFWQIDFRTGDFAYAKEVASASRAMNKNFARWLNSLTYEDRELATKVLFEIFHERTVFDLLKNFGKDIVLSRKVLADYSKEDQDKLKNIIKNFFKYAIFFTSHSEKAKQVENIDNPKQIGEAKEK